MDLNNKAIPELDLVHAGAKVNFAFRTMEEIHALTGQSKDIPHRHNYYTVLWASKACGQHYMDYVEHPIKPNHVFFVNPGQVHQVITFGQPEGYVIMFTPEYLQQFMISKEFITNLGLFSDSADTPPLVINADNSNNLKSLVKNIEKAFRSDEPFKDEQISAYLKLFLITCNKFAPALPAENTQSLQSSRKIISDFKTLIESNYRNWHKVTDYATKLNITSDYLNSVIKSTIGKTAKEFIQNRICLEAKRLGIHTQLTSKEIAYQLGFDDPSHFSKFFKNCEGLSFSDFRQSLEVSLSES